MPTLIEIILATVLASVGSLIGGLVLLSRRKLAESVAHILTSFAAGALLGTALFDLLPEALEHAEEMGSGANIFLWVVIGVLSFYLLERGVHWFHYHRAKAQNVTHKRPTIALIMFGDSMHNFIDGVAIAITFLVNPSVGILTTLAIAAHEIPQEIGDFAVMLHEGLSRKKVLLFNIGSALLALLGAVLAYTVGQRIEAILPYALSLTSGFFLYIALASLIPEIHHEEKRGYAFWESFSLVLGVVVVWGAITLLEQGH